MAATDLNLYLTVTTPVADTTFEVVRFEGEEHISELFHYRVELGADNLNVDFTQLLGKSITVNILHESGAESYHNGIVTRLSQTISQENAIIYVADLHPWLWLLTKSSDFRIFQNKSTPDIIKAIFSDLGFTDFKDSLTATYTAREYCTQYGETAFDFITRLMEDEGIFYFFTHEDGKHTLVLADDADAHVDCPGLTKALHFRRFGATWDEEDAIDDCTFEQRVGVNEYRMDDYNFETPATDLGVSVKGASDGTTLSVMEYPGGHLTKDVAEKRAKGRIESHELPVKILHGQSNCRLFVAGHKFTLSKFDREDVNGSYVLRRVTHEATQDGYRNTFEAFPAAVPFRPPLVARKPEVAGYETATVVGKSGEEIWTDQYGRVKVQFPWDSRGTNDENSSCWIRVAQGWAGKGWGTMWIPRINTEVIVCFLNGDPDRPMIVGTVYNAQQTLPYTLPDDQTKSTIKTNTSKGGEGFNEIRFEDKKDSEEIFINAQKDVNVIVTNNWVDSIKNSRQVFIQKDEPALDDAAKDVLIVDGTRKVTVKGADNEELHTNEGKFTQNVTKDFTLTVDGDTLTITAKGDIKIKGKTISLETTGGDLKMKSSADTIIDAGANLTAKAAQASSNKAGTDLKNEAGTALTNKAGTDLKNEAGTSLTNKAGTTMENKASISMTNDGGVSLTNKASATQTVDGGGMLTVKGGLVKIN